MPDFMPFSPGNHRNAAVLLQGVMQMLPAAAGLWLALTGANSCFQTMLHKVIAVASLFTIAV